MVFSIYKSPIGDLMIISSDEGVSSLWFVDEGKREEMIKKTEKQTGSWLIEGTNDIIVLTKKQLKEYFEGDRFEFKIPLDINGTNFQFTIWNLLKKIPFGKTKTYLQMAKVYGDSHAVRAVGHAIGENPVGIVIPCHRVLGSKGELTGYAGGLWRKEWLIEHEQKMMGVEQTRLF
jgi:O-6-methylguanine DNA methyltransferase